VTRSAGQRLVALAIFAASSTATGRITKPAGLRSRLPSLVVSIAVRVDAVRRSGRQIGRPDVSERPLLALRTGINVGVMTASP
jgi:hypothetical protein